MRTQSFGGRTRYREQRQRFSQRNSTAPRRDDPIRGHVRGSFRRSRPSASRRARRNGVYHCRGYRAAKIRPPSARALSDQLLGGEMLRLHSENYGVYTVRNMHALMRRSGGRSAGIGPTESCALSGFVESIAAHACSRQSPILRVWNRRICRNAGSPRPPPAGFGLLTSPMFAPVEIQ